MILKRRVALNGVQLDSLDNRVLVQTVEPQAGKMAISGNSLWGADGSRVTNIHRDSVDVNVKFSINEKSYHPEERSAVFEKVMAWAAAGGWLTVNNKPNRRIRVICAQPPGEGDLMNRNQYTIVFRAYGVPYWQEEEAVRVRFSGNGGSRVFGVGGNVRTVMDCSFRNTSGGTINSLTITAGSSSFTFTGLGLGNGETLTIDHPDDGKHSWLRIRIGSRSALVARTAGSSDDLYVMPGERTVSFSGGSGVAEFSCSGRFA